MKIIYLRQATPNLRRFRRYYRETFPEGRINALRRFDATELLLAENPEAGRAIEGRRERRYHIPRTPFSLICRVVGDRIEVLKVHDGRSGTGAMV